MRTSTFLTLLLASSVALNAQTRIQLDSKPAGIWYVLKYAIPVKNLHLYVRPESSTPPVRGARLEIKAWNTEKIVINL